MLSLSMDKAYQCDQFSNQTDVGAEQAQCDCVRATKAVSSGGAGTGVG